MDKAARSTRPPVPLGRRFVESPNGILVPATITAPSELDLTRVFTKIGRGLFWWKQGELPKDPRMVVRLLNPGGFNLWTHRLKQPVQQLGDEVWWMSAVEPCSAIWLFMMFGAVGVGVWQGAATELPNLPTPSGVVMREGAEA